MNKKSKDFETLADFWTHLRSGKYVVLKEIISCIPTTVVDRFKNKKICMDREDTSNIFPFYEVDLITGKRYLVGEYSSSAILYIKYWQPYTGPKQPNKLLCFKDRKYGHITFALAEDENKFSSRLWERIPEFDVYPQNVRNAEKT